MIKRLEKNLLCRLNTLSIKKIPGKAVSVVTSTWYQRIFTTCRLGQPHVSHPLN